MKRKKTLQESEDRLVAQVKEIGERLWSFSGVFLPVAGAPAEK
jgi:hypothetical protein